MIAGILIFLALCAPGVWCAASRGRRFEELLPVSAMGIVLVLFVFGLLSKLEWGVYGLLLLGAYFYLLTGISLWKRKNRRTFRGNLVTPGFCIFLAAYCGLTLLNRGRLANTWDEFSHWIDVVKVMTTQDDFATNPGAFSGYASYPPGMALFQYFFQKVSFLCGGERFSEGSTYTAYQVLTFCLFFPFLRKLSFRKPAAILPYLAGVFLAPMLFHNFFASIFIEGFLGVCSGVGMSMIFLYPREEKDTLYIGTIGMLCAMLALAKDAGIVFALFLAGAFLLDRRLAGEKGLLPDAVALLGAVLPRLLWMLEVRLSPQTSGINPPEYIQGVFGADRMAVLRTFFLGLYEKEFPIGNSGIGISCIGMIFLTLTGLCALYVCWKGGSNRRKAVVVTALGTQLLCWVVGLAASYLFVFTKYESLNLMCFERYLGAGLLPIWCLGVLALLNALENSRRMDTVRFLAVFFAMLAVFPTRPMVNFVSRSYVSVARANRAAYEEITNLIRDTCEEGSFVYMVDQNHDGADFWRIKFLARPVIVKNVCAWSLGIPSQEDLNYTQQKTAEGWLLELREEYDYVLLYHVDDYFRDGYGSLFENPGEIREGCIYRVDKQDGLLKFVKGED